MAVNITSHKSNSDQSSIIDTHKLKIEFNPKELLDNFKKWKLVKNDLIAMEGNFNVAGIPVKVYQLLREIDRYTYMGEFQKLFNAGKWISDLVRDAFKKGDNPKIGTIDQKENKPVANLIDPPFDVLQVLGVVDIVGNKRENKSVEYFAIHGYCLKVTHNENDDTFIIICPSIPSLSIQDENRDQLKEKAELEIKSMIKKCIEDQSKPPVPLPWREQYKLIFS